MVTVLVMVTGVPNSRENESVEARKYTVLSPNRSDTIQMLVSYNRPYICTYAQRFNGLFFKKKKYFFFFFLNYLPIFLFLLNLVKPKSPLESSNISAAPLWSTSRTCTTTCILHPDFLFVCNSFSSFCQAEWNVPILDGRCWDTHPEHFM